MSLPPFLKLGGQRKGKTPLSMMTSLVAPDRLLRSGSCCGWNLAPAIVCALGMALIGCGERKSSETKSDTKTASRSETTSSTGSGSLKQEMSAKVFQVNRNPVGPANLELLAGSFEKQLAAVDELVELGSPQAVEELMSFVVSLPDGDLKEEVVRRSSSITNRESMPTVLAHLVETQDSGVLRMSREIFGRLVDPESIQTLLDDYDSSSDQITRERLAVSVSYISNEIAVPVLMQIMSAPDTSATDGMVRASAQALRQIGTAPAVDALIERINSETSEEDRALLAAEVGRVTNPLAETSLQIAATGSSKFANTPDARVAAIWGLVNYPSAETREQLTRLQNDSNSQVGFAALEALKVIENRLRVP